jgi:hypothetical protein
VRKKIFFLEAFSSSIKFPELFIGYAVPQNIRQFQDFVALHPVYVIVSDACPYSLCRKSLNIFENMNLGSSLNEVPDHCWAMQRRFPAGEQFTSLPQRIWLSGAQGSGHWQLFSDE